MWRRLGVLPKGSYVKTKKYYKKGLRNSGWKRTFAADDDGGGCIVDSEDKIQHHIGERDTASAYEAIKSQLKQASTSHAATSAH